MLPEGPALAIGVCLQGGGGGEWSVLFGGGAARVEKGLDADRAFTWVQSVRDWRGALWEGRGGEGGKWARRAFDPVALSKAAAENEGAAPAATGTLAKVADADGLFELCITGAPGGDWAAAAQLGAGEIAEKPDARVTLSDDDACALTSGALSPMEALLKGRVRVDGDSALLLKLPGLARAAARR